MSLKASLRPQFSHLAPADARVRRLYWLALALAIAVLPALAIDLPLARLAFAVHHEGPGDLRKAVAMFEAFGHGVGAVVIIAAVAVLDRVNRYQCWRLVGCSFGAGIVNLIAKTLIGRHRPQTFEDAAFPPAVFDTFPAFVDWQLALARDAQSFPSGHSAMAAGLATGLAWLYPQGRYFFATLAALTMLQRVESGAHFPSDTLAGAAVGVMVAALCCDDRWWAKRQA